MPEDLEQVIGTSYFFAWYPAFGSLIVFIYFSSDENEEPIDWNSIKSE